MIGNAKCPCFGPVVIVFAIVFGGAFSEAQEGSTNREETEAITSVDVDGLKAGLSGQYYETEVTVME